jgi:hypothetical protein
LCINKVKRDNNAVGDADDDADDVDANAECGDINDVVM